MKYLPLLALAPVGLLLGAADVPPPGNPAPHIRPATWAQPVVGAGLQNLSRVSADLYRSEQPEDADLKDLQALQIKTVISLRHYHHDPAAFEKAGIKCIQYKMDAGSVTPAQLTEVLGLIRDSPKPVLVHCWHGSDRTGFIVAGYRIACMNWPVEEAVEELRLGGFGYHEATYPNIKACLRGIDVNALRKSVSSAPAVSLASPPAPPPGG